MTKLYTVQEAAEIMNVSVAAIRKWILERRIGFHKIGHLIRFSEQNLSEFTNRRSFNAS